MSRKRKVIQFRDKVVKKWKRKSRTYECVRGGTITSLKLLTRASGLSSADITKQPTCEQLEITHPSDLLIMARRTFRVSTT